MKVDNVTLDEFLKNNKIMPKIFTADAYIAKDKPIF
jgi:hypothetical protein